MTLGEKIKAARKSAGLSQEQLAERLRVSRAAVAKWESGGGLPDILNLKALAELFGVTMEELLDESKIPGCTGSGRRSAWKITGPPDGAGMQLTPRW